MTSSEHCVGVHYRVGRKIGEGSFGVIFEGINVLNKQKIAIKFEPRKSDAPQLRDEYRTYKILVGCPGIPNVYYFGQEGLHNILVIDLLGPSLEDLFDECKRRFSQKTVVMLAKQMLSRVQTIHEKNLIYRDIKPDNFLVNRTKDGQPPFGNIVHVVDFGMAKQYRDPKTKQHIPYRERKSLSGTARYMSINTHCGYEQSRRDDLEALGHVFMYFLRGSLPWQGLKANTNKQKYEKIGQTKKTHAIEQLCDPATVMVDDPNADKTQRDRPKVRLTQVEPNLNWKKFEEYLKYVRGLGFEDTPDYDYLRGLMTEALPKGEVEDGVYDWQMLPPRGASALHSPNARPGATTMELHGSRVNTNHLSDPRYQSRRLNLAGISDPASTKPLPSPPAQARQSGLGLTSPSPRMPAPLATPRLQSSMDAHFANSAQNLPQNSATPTGNQNMPSQPNPEPSGFAKFMKTLCCG